MTQRKKSKEERRREQEILDQYHQKLTEDKLELLFHDFLNWKQGELPYHELTECIHEFHKANQEIWKTFSYIDRAILLIYAKKELGILTSEELERSKFCFEDDQ